MAGKIATLPGFADCDPHEQADILAADQEWQKEIGYFVRWREQKNNPYREGQPASPLCPEWETIDRYWDAPAPPEPIADFLSCFMHDSRASFKPLGKDLPALQDELDKLILREEQGGRLTAQEKNRLRNYQLSRDPNAIEPAPDGRESLALGGGYLRYRKIYLGSNSFKPAGAHHAQRKPAVAEQQHVAAPG